MAATRSRLDHSAWSAWCRWVLVGAAVVAAAAHVPGAREHLAEAPYMGFAFAGFTAACVAVAAVAASRPGRGVYAAAAGLCGSALVTYAATRLVAFPRLAGDVGNWAEPLGLVSVAAESLVVVAAVLLLRAGGWHRHSAVVSQRS